MTYVICEPCIDVKDTACVDVCPVDCIHPTADNIEFYEEEVQLTSIQKNALIVQFVNQNVLLKQFMLKMTFQKNGKASPKRMQNFLLYEI